MNAQVELFNSDSDTKTNQGPFALEQLNFVEVLVERYNREVIELDKSIETINNLNSTSKNLMSVLGVNFKPSQNREKLQHLLNVEYWNSVYFRSNISQYLDADKRSEWSSKLHVNEENKAELPEFTIENVTSTLKSWYADRESMFMDRVDLVFRSLSKSHVTNQPEGFSKKLIFSNGCDMSWSSGMDIKWQTEEKIYDLECIICMLTNRPTPERRSIHAKKSLKLGIKHSYLGDSYQLQVFKSGTIHFWIHPSLAIELNIWLAKKYPSAIPSQHRVKSKNIKDFVLNYDVPSSSDVSFLEAIVSSNYVGGYDQKTVDRFLKFSGLSFAEVDKPIRERSRSVLNIALMILRNGYPNIKDHQFYPTPDAIVEDVADYLGGRTESAKVLEPSTGTGKLASIFNADNVTCIEVNSFFCEALGNRGFENINNLDFLKYKTSEKFDVIAMNPPYSEKRLELHLQKALTHLADEGELILIAPTGKKSKIEEIAKGYTVEIVKSHKNEFEDTTISTSIFSLTK